jgi:hypothetical protein
MIVPVGIPASTFEDPSRGSKTATYFSPSSMTISVESDVARPIKSTCDKNNVVWKRKKKRKNRCEFR